MGTYSFQDNTLTITGPGGSFVIGGQGAGNAEEGFDIEMAQDKNTMMQGADGSVAHSLAASNAAILTVRLLKTSPVNAQLSSLYNTQKVSISLWGQNTITMKNGISGDSYTLIQAAFKRLPKNTYAKDANVLEWQFDVAGNNAALGSGGTVASAAALVQQSV